jgi:hypothetical protein
MPRRRRWFRFSLRTFLIAFTLASLAFGFFFNRVQNERRAAKAIGEAHGEIVYHWQIRLPGSDAKVQPTPPGPQWLRERIGPHWFDRIVEVGLNGFINNGDKNRFAVVGPYLTKLWSLRSLSLWGEELDDNEYRLLGRLTQLEKLRVSQETPMRPQHAAALARATSLRELHLDNAKISPEALKELAKLPNMEALDIDCSSYDRKTGKTLKQYQLRDEAAEAIATFPRLRSLMLFATQITDEGMEAIGRLTHLETLVVSSPNITSASFDHVAGMKHLKHLGTWEWKMDDAHLKKLSQFPSLTSLGLVTDLTDKSVIHLSELEQIERLTLNGDAITDASVPYLRRLHKLEWLNLSHTSIDKLGRAAKELRQAFPKCMINLPKTEKEKEMERAFHRSKWGGGG